MLFAIAGTFFFHQKLKIDPSPQIRKDFLFVLPIVFVALFYFFWKAFAPQSQGRLFITIVVNAVTTFLLSWATFVGLTMFNNSSTQPGQNQSFKVVELERVKNKKTGTFTSEDYTYYVYLEDAEQQISCFRFNFEPNWYIGEMIQLRVKTGKLGYCFSN